MEHPQPCEAVQLGKNRGQPIECDFVVTARMHAVSCDICEGWQHRRCGTGKIIFVLINANFHIFLSRKLTAIETRRFFLTKNTNSQFYIFYKPG